MIPVAAFDTWLHSVLGLDSTVQVYGPDKLDMDGLADRAVFITPNGGPGLLLEQLFDVPTYQFLVRGTQRSYDDAEALARDIDNRVVTTVLPTTIDSRRVIRVNRVGGPPAYLRRDKGGRSQFTCSYLFELPTG